MTEPSGEPAPATKPLAVVTGASSGIGFKLAKAFANNGFHVLVNAEDGGLEAAAEQLRAAGAHVQPAQADLSNYEELEELYASNTSLMPGPTDTNFFHRAGMEDTQVGQAQKDDPAQVAKQGSTLS
jgi:NAD(P)-dependent dehydrogenase (short-subunit alcohol dehydrogenase family)